MKKARIAGGMEENTWFAGFKNPDAFFDFIDRYYQANLAKLTAGMSPAAFNAAYCSCLCSERRQCSCRALEIGL